MTEWTGEIKDVVTALTAVAAVCIANKGLTTWQRQLGGQQQHDLARRLLVGIYKLRKAVTGVRFPFTFAAEAGDPPPNADKMSHEQVRHYGTEQTYQKRWQRVMDAQVALEADLLEAEALWGDAFNTLYGRLSSLVNELLTVVTTELRLLNPDTNQITKEALQKIKERRRDIFYDLSDDATGELDGYASDLRNAVGAIEAYLKPRLIRPAPTIPDASTGASNRIFASIRSALTRGRPSKT